MIGQYQSADLIGVFFRLGICRGNIFSTAAVIVFSRLFDDVNSVSFDTASSLSSIVETDLEISDDMDL